jgi:hypothetical protein
MAHPARAINGWPRPASLNLTRRVYEMRSGFTAGERQDARAKPAREPVECIQARMEPGDAARWVKQRFDSINTGTSPNDKPQAASSKAKHPGLKRRVTRPVGPKRFRRATTSASLARVKRRGVEGQDPPPQRAPLSRSHRGSIGHEVGVEPQPTQRLGVLLRQRHAA